MLEPYSDEEKKYIMYLVKKYLPVFGIQEDRDAATIMYEKNAKTKKQRSNWAINNTFGAILRYMCLLKVSKLIWYVLDFWHFVIIYLSVMNNRVHHAIKQQRSQDDMLWWKKQLGPNLKKSRNASNVQWVNIRRKKS